MLYKEHSLLCIYELEDCFIFCVAANAFSVTNFYICKNVVSVNIAVVNINLSENGEKFSKKYNY